MTTTDLIASLRQYTADKVATMPTPKYDDNHFRRVIARAINYLPQLQGATDGSYIRSRDHLPILFDASEPFTNLSNVTIDGHLSLTNPLVAGRVDRPIGQQELRPRFRDLLFLYVEAKRSGNSGGLTLDLSLDGGATMLKAQGFETTLPLGEYLDLSSYAKTGLTVRFALSAGALVVDSAQLYFLFLKQEYLLRYAASLEWAAMGILTQDLAQEAMSKNYDITVINGLLLSANTLMRRATGRTSEGEPLERPQSQDPGLGLKSSQLGGQGRDGTGRSPVERTEYGKAVDRVFR